LPSWEIRCRGKKGAKTNLKQQATKNVLEYQTKTLLALPLL
jgi:hypothetical protein